MWLIKQLPAQVFRSLLLVGIAIFFLLNTRKASRVIDGQYEFFSRMEKKNREIISDMDIISDNFNFTKREREVLEKLLQGKSYKQIASELFVSPDTVKSHVKNIYRKADVGGRFELMEKLKSRFQH